MVVVEKFFEGFKCSQGLRGFHAVMDAWLRLYYNWYQIDNLARNTNSVMPALKRTRLTASVWWKTNWCINCVLMRVMECRERDNS